MPNSDHFLTLLTFAEAYYYLGYSVIPLLGDSSPARPKVPAIPWNDYQKYRASLTEQHQWFDQGKFAGLGIVTGRISQLVVLDFDSESIFNAFKVQHPDLIETHTVRSAGRQLPHLYFRLLPHLHLPTIKGQGVDLLSDGCYVVAPPTTIRGQAYKITRGGMPKTLTERDVRRIEAFMRSPPMNTSQNAQKLLICNNLSLKHPSPSPCPVTSPDLQALYHHLVGKRGRNESLFLASLHARNSGWTQQQTEESLLSLHIQQASTGSHHHETPSQRQREALNTIRSAFSKPARPLQNHSSHKQGALSNSVREALMQRGMTYFIRTYEGLLHAGIRPGAVVSAKEAVEHLKGLVGRFSILNALKAKEGDQSIFPLPINPSKTASAVATDNAGIDSDKCLSEGSKDQILIKKGRPAYLFRIPTNDELCDILGVDITPSDPLEQDDLASAPKTRMALHRELIKRRPGQYGKGWLARRLGVNKRTIATYNKLIPIHSKAMYIETPVNWGNIERLLPLDEPIQGAVLVTHMDKRYPALRSIASRLLAKGEGIVLKQQTANFYWYGEEPIIARLQVQQDVEVRQEHLEKYLAQQQVVSLPVYQTQISHQSGVSAAGKARSVVVKKPISKQSFLKTLKDPLQEEQAQRLYNTLNLKAGKQISLANARKLVTIYNPQVLENALTLVMSRNKVNNPAGFLITILHSSHSRL